MLAATVSTSTTLNQRLARPPYRALLSDNLLYYTNSGVLIFQVDCKTGCNLSNDVYEPRTCSPSPPSCTSHTAG
jgi:hypothetical protein